MTDPDTTVSEPDTIDSVVGIGPTKGFTLPRDCEVMIVPAGHRIILPKGDRVKLLQALGGSATVTTREGEMARLSARDSIDFGFIKGRDDPAAPSDDVPFSIDLVWEAATTIYDPEIPVDIVELGLVYRVDAEELASGRQRVEVDMSVTAPFCGMGDVLRQELHDAISILPGVEDVEVKLVYDPPWTASRMSDVARLELGMM